MQKSNSGNKSADSSENMEIYRVLDDIDEINQELRTPRRHFGFAQFVRDKNNYDYNEKLNIAGENLPNSYMYNEKLSLNSLKPSLMIFKNYWLKKTSLMKATMEDVSGLLTVKDYSEGLTRFNP